MPVDCLWGSGNRTKQRSPGSSKASLIMNFIIFPKDCSWHCSLQWKRQSFWKLMFFNPLILMRWHHLCLNFSVFCNLLCRMIISTILKLYDFSMRTGILNSMIYYKTARKQLHLPSGKSLCFVVSFKILQSKLLTLGLLLPNVMIV